VRSPFRPARRPAPAADRGTRGGGSGLSRIAARTLTSEAVRHPGPKQVTVLGDDDRVVRAVLDRLAPADRLTVCAPSPERAAQVRATLERHAQRHRDRGRDRGRDPGRDRDRDRDRDRPAYGRVAVLDVTPEEAGEPPTDVLVVCDPVTGSEGEAREAVERCSALLGPQGVLSLAAPLPAGRGGAAGEVERVATVCGVRSERVLRSRPPLRVHHLRFTVADPGLAERLAPAWSPTRVALGRGVALDVDGAVALAALTGVTVVLAVLRPRRPWWLVPAVAAVPVAALFRDPHREPPADPEAVVAPGDGTVASVERLRDERLGPGEWLRIAVALSVLDVHVVRSPVAGRVVALLDGGGTRGVARYTLLETPRGPAVVAQRVGRVGRRIVHRAPVGALLSRGERFGLLRLGSRTDVYLPADLVEAAVAPGDRVVGAESVLARYRPRPRRRPSPHPAP